MPDNSDATNKLKLARAKSKATAKTIKLLIFVQGSFALVLAGILTAILSTTMHLNAPLVFIGSLVGLFILSASRSTVKNIWESEFAMACQEEGLWSEASKIASQGIEGAIKEILEGKYPQEGGPELGLKVSQLQIIAIRKGDTKTAAKYAEFLYRESADNQENRTYQVGALGCINVELGNYERGFQLLEGNLDELEANGRADAPACVTSLLGLLQGAIDLERFAEAEKYLARLKKTIELSHSTASNNSTDRWVKQEAGNKSIENAFYVNYSAKLKHAKSDPAAELELLEAFEIAKDPEVRSRVTLLYPELLVYHAQVMLNKDDFEKAEKLADQAAVYYETKTQNRGNDYIRAKSIKAFARFKKGADTLVELTGYLKDLKEHLFEPHPIIATGHVQIAEVLAKQGHFEKAREHLQEAFKIRQRLFPENSPGIREAEKLLASLPAIEAGATLDDIA